MYGLISVLLAGVEEGSSVVHIDGIQNSSVFEEIDDQLGVVSLCSPVKSGLLALVEVMDQVTVILDHEFYGLSLVAFDSVEELF